MSRGNSAASTKSVQKAIKSLENFIKTIDSIPETELEQTAQNIKAKAIAQVPYETGELERSIYCRVVKLGKTRHTIHAGANAFDNGYNYAGIQHENTEFHHPIKGKAHYISDPFKVEITNLKRRLRRKMRISK